MVTTTDRSRGREEILLIKQIEIGLTREKHNNNGKWIEKKNKRFSQKDQSGDYTPQKAQNKYKKPVQHENKIDGRTKLRKY